MVTNPMTPASTKKIYEHVSRVGVSQFFDSTV